MSEIINLEPCPFCGSKNLRESEAMFFDDDGEHAGIECLKCDAINRTKYWNLRHADASFS